MFILHDPKHLSPLLCLATGKNTAPSFKLPDCTQQHGPEETGLGVLSDNMSALIFLELVIEQAD